jgi:hypothetical protein
MEASENFQAPDALPPGKGLLSLFNSRMGGLESW